MCKFDILNKATEFIYDAANEVKDFSRVYWGVR